VYANCVLARRVSLLSLRPIPQWAALEGCTAVALMPEHDDARQARRDTFHTHFHQPVCITNFRITFSRVFLIKCIKMLESPLRLALLACCILPVIMGWVSSICKTGTQPYIYSIMPYNKISHITCHDLIHDTPVVLRKK